MKNFPLIWKYYSREEIQKAILEIAKDREIVGVYSSGAYDKRPNTLQYPEDILQMIKKGIIAFHGSVERWSNPIALEPGMLKQELDRLRIGWDLIIDPDCPDFEISKLVVKKIIEALDDHSIKKYSLKYTGGKSFHIGIPFESFPKKINSQKTETLYPDLPKKIMHYLKDYLKDPLKEEMLELDNPLSLAKRVGKTITDITDKDGLNPLKIVEIDSMMVISRHMFRLPYSLHEKSLLVSVPIRLKQLDDLKKGFGNPWKFQLRTKFLSEKPEIAEANSLVVEALDWHEKNKPKEEKMSFEERKRNVKNIPKKYFPGCILKIMKGLPDGRKRSVFTLITFLRNMGWDWYKIEQSLKQWNEKNQPPLPVNYINTQLRWHQRQQRNILPPNCENENFYKNTGVCLSDNFCRNLKNPINYAFRRMKEK